MRVRDIRWRKEDAAYATATLVTVAVVVYLLAGNFGLVPSLLAPSRPADRPVVGVPMLAEPAATTLAAPDVVPGVPVIVTDALLPEAPQPPAGTVALDPAPEVTVSTPDGTVMVRLTSEARVTGTARNADRVMVTFQAGEPEQVEANLSCQGTRCTWSAPAPGILGSYVVSAEAIAPDGRSATSTSIAITVVGGAVLPLGPTEDEPNVLLGVVGDVLDPVVGAITGLLGP